MEIFKPKLKDKRWKIKYEEELLDIWLKEGLYEFKFEEGRPTFSIDTPPPYASGIWHVAATAHYVQFDIFARYFKMKGYNVYFPMGIDRNGLPVEIKVEQEYGVKARHMDREKFIQLCREKLDEYEKYILEVIRRTGMLADYINPYRTDDPDYRAFTQATFIEMWKRGLIYEDDRPTIWCPECYTPIAEAEIEYKEFEGRLYYIKFPFPDSDEGLIIATTRPELIGATAAVLYHPEDDRYREYEGREVVIPIYDYKVKVIPHPIVDPEYGSGVMMLSSYGDLDDVRLFRELGLTPRILISPDGTMNELSGRYKGLKVREAREAIVKDLDNEGYLIKVEKVKQRIPLCWRSKNPVEFINVKALYLRQLDFKDQLMKIIDEIRFIPEFHKQILINWINSISIDWAISRERYYGTEVPIWYCKRCGTPHVPSPGKYYRPWKDKAPFDKCIKCGYTEFIGDTRTFDTWMDSSVSCLYISKYGRDENLFKHLFPVSVRPQGIDIVRTWLYYTLLRVYLLTGRPAFKYVRLSGMGLDKEGRPMSKSLGNIVEPLPVIEKYGADAFRIWSASDTKIGYNYNYDEKKIEAARNFVTKIWNISRFISSFPDLSGKVKLDELMELDKQILSRVNKVIETADREYSNLDSFETMRELRYFTWEVFASHYMELVKPRVYNKDNQYTEDERRSAYATLHLVLKTILKILHPVAPFVTDYIWRELYGGGILNQRFPERFDVDVDVELMDEIMELNSRIWRFKAENGLKKRDPIKRLTLPPRFKPIEKDLKIFHNIEMIEYSEEIGGVSDLVIEV